MLPLLLKDGLLFAAIGSTIPFLLIMMCMFEDVIKDVFSKSLVCIHILIVHTEYSTYVSRAYFAN